jgi:hypothetical protein
MGHLKLHICLQRLLLQLAAGGCSNKHIAIPVFKRLRLDKRRILESWTKSEVTPLLSMIRSDAIEKRDAKIFIEKHIRCILRCYLEKPRLKVRDQKTRAVFTRYKAQLVAK